MGEQLRAAAPEVSVPRVPAGAGSRGRGAGGRRFSRGGPGLGRQRAGRGRAAGRDWGLGPEGPPPAGLCPPPRPPGRCASLFIPLFLRIPTASPPPPHLPAASGRCFIHDPAGLCTGSGRLPPQFAKCCQTPGLGRGGRAGREGSRPGGEMAAGWARFSHPGGQPGV